MEMRDISFCNLNNWPSLISSRVHVARALVATSVSIKKAKVFLSSPLVTQFFSLTFYLSVKINIC